MYVDVLGVCYTDYVCASDCDGDRNSKILAWADTDRLHSMPRETAADGPAGLQAERMTRVVPSFPMPKLPTGDYKDRIDL